MQINNTYQNQAAPKPYVSVEFCAVRIAIQVYFYALTYHHTGEIHSRIGTRTISFISSFIVLQKSILCFLCKQVFVTAKPLQVCLLLPSANKGSYGYQQLVSSKTTVYLIQKLTKNLRIFWDGQNQIFLTGIKSY